MSSPSENGDSPDPRAALVVAIDGPSGSGKSTVARLVAQHLGLRYLDTGAMYRALTWWVLDQGVDPSDSDAVARLAGAFPLVMGTDAATPGVAVGDVDVAEAIRDTRISSSVSAVATNPDVRIELRRRQRAVVEAGGVVAEGRDITTVVAADAPVRVLLVASEEARLRRRALEVHGSADSEAVEATRDQIVRRDRDDSTVSQFHEAAEGVEVVDSSDLNLEETVQAVLDIVRERTGIEPAPGGSA